MNPVPLFGLGIQSKAPNVTAQKRINLYLEFLPEQDKTQVVAYGTPGLKFYTDRGDDPIRGARAFGNYFYIVHRGNFLQIDSTGAAVIKGLIDAITGKVSIEDNGTQIMIATGASGYIYNTSTDTFSQITDPDYPGGDTVTFLDGYFIVNRPDTGQFWISASYDGLNWDALEFATAESNPDNLVRVFSDHGQLHLFGDLSTEFWSNSGALDFPYSRVTSIEWGLAARWSVAKFSNSLIYLAKNRLGEVQVVMLNGYSPSIVSTPDLAAIFKKYAVVSDASGFSYMYNQHPFYQINFPSAGESWLYDGLSSAWSQLKGYGITRHRAEFGIAYNGLQLGFDYENGLIYSFDGETYTDNGQPLISELIGKHYYQALELFTIREFQVDCEVGNGLENGQGSDPQMMLRVSRDGGRTYGAERWRSIGKIGKYRTRARWLRLGEGRDFEFHIKISDPIKRVLIGAWMK